MSEYTVERIDRRTEEILNIIRNAPTVVPGVSYYLLDNQDEDQENQ